MPCRRPLCYHFLRTGTRQRPRGGRFRIDGKKHDINVNVKPTVRLDDGSNRPRSKAEMAAAIAEAIRTQLEGKLSAKDLEAIKVGREKDPRIKNPKPDDEKLWVVQLGTDSRLLDLTDKKHLGIFRPDLEGDKKLKVVASIAFPSLPGGLAGIDELGTESIFASSLATDSFIALATVPFGEIPGGTLDGLVATMYERLRESLPEGLRPILRLDRPGQRILFDFPFEDTTVRWISTTGSDTGVEAYASLAAVPEAETCAMFLAGLGLMAAAARRRRAG